MQSTQARHLQQWVVDHIVESHGMVTEDQEIANINRQIDQIGRVIAYLALSFGILTVIVQLWKWFH